ncbi:MAG: nitrous oxide reductase accessory protein NosL [Bacteroidetes bacterium]|nr:nitrous oxide reductase accessory protein NosL [Bacteroidota bacterium]
MRDLTIFFVIIKEKKYLINSFYYFVLLLTISSCKSGPEKLQYSKDSCAFCKMQLMDKKYGAELVTEKGKVYKFDDTGCMLNYEKQNFGSQKVALELVVDYSNPGQLINVLTAFHIKCAAAYSPMGSNLASFEKEETVNKYIQQLQGEKISWDAIKKSFNK